MVSDGPKGGHSPFARCIIEYLKSKPSESVIAKELELHVEHNTSKSATQNPEGAIIFGLGDQGGQFVFVPNVVKEIAWEDLEGNLEACRAYVQDYPQGQWVEAAYWEIASLSDKLRDYQAYARKFLRGKYINQALEKIESLEEKEAYEAAEKRGWTALVRFINQYPDSQYVVKAEAVIQRLTRTESKKSEEKKVEPRIEVKEEKEKPESKHQELLKSPIEMVLVEGGTFMMGSEKGFEDEKPVHKVKLSSFYIGKYPVTQKQWEEIMGDNPSHFKGCSDCPVEKVSWDDAKLFVEKINQKYPGLNYRLPTEAEWEFA
ncbi:MAG: formylglycine-generating enzyme family protein, partial [Bacteroidia bacterium]